MDNINVSSSLSQTYLGFVDHNSSDVRKTVDYGVLIGGLLSDCGWLSEAIEVLNRAFYKGKSFFLFF